MALISCEECGAKISDQAPACPSCGIPLTARPTPRAAPSPAKVVGSVASDIWMLIKIGVALLFVFMVYQCTTSVSKVASAVNMNKAADTFARVVVPDPVPSAPACTVFDITIKSQKARFVDRYMKGVAVIVNGCKEPVGVQVKITALDKAGAPVASRDLWPASINNIPPGEYTFSLDHYLEYDPSMRSFIIEPVAVRNWR